MTASELYDYFQLPPDAMVDQRIPKKLLVENGAPTAGDKRQINDGIEELLWLATLKPTTIGVPEYCDAFREYLEIAILSLTFRPTAKAGRLVELIHRAIPYPVVLLTQQSEIVTLSLAHKRWSQGETGKVVLDDTVIVCEIFQNPVMPDFLGSMPLAKQSRDHLMALYQGWIDCIRAFQAACITGHFTKFADEKAASIRSEALAEYDRLLRQISILRAQAERETQVNRRVDLNIEIKGLEVELAGATARL